MLKAGTSDIAAATLRGQRGHIGGRRMAGGQAARMLVGSVVAILAAAGCGQTGTGSPAATGTPATSATAGGTATTVVTPTTGTPSASASGGASSSAPAGGVIKVAQISAHSGTLAQLGAWDEEALKLAFKEKNDAGGACGRQLELTIYDNQGDPTVGKNVTQQALDTGIVAAFATTESTVTLAVIPQFQEAKVPHFTAGQSNAITEAGSAYVFRDGPPASAFNKTLASYVLKDKAWTKFVMVSNTGAYGSSERGAFLAELTAASITPLADATVTPEAQDFTTPINDIQRLQPEAIYTGMEEIQTGLFAKQLRTLGITAPIIGGPPAGTPQFVEVAGDAADGSIFASPYITNDANDRTRAFAAAFKAMHGKDPEFHGAKGYDGAQLLFQAIEKACADLTGEGIAKALHTISGYEGLQGTFNVQENGETLTETQVGTIEDGVAVLAK